VFTGAAIGITRIGVQRRALLPIGGWTPRTACNAIPCDHTCAQAASAACSMCRARTLREMRALGRGIAAMAIKGKGGRLQQSLKFSALGTDK